MERYTQRREETWALAEGAELSRALDRLRLEQYRLP